MNIKKFLQIGVLILFAGLLLVSCNTAVTIEPTAPVIETAPPESTPVPATPTAIPRTLTICLGQEPTTLYLYGGSGRSMWSVLEAIYDGPFDTRSFEAQPVILEKLPSLNPAKSPTNRLRSAGEARSSIWMESWYPCRMAPRCYQQDAIRRIVQSYGMASTRFKWTRWSYGLACFPELPGQTGLR